MSGKKCKKLTNDILAAELLCQQFQVTQGNSYNHTRGYKDANKGPAAYGHSLSSYSIWTL